MTHRVVFIHTVPPLIEVFSQLGRVTLPDVELLHILDEPLLERVVRQGGLRERDVERMRSHVDVAADVGAQAVLVTCSTLSQAVDAVRADVSLPVLKIDEAMAAEAVRKGARIDVIATNRTTLEPTRFILLQAARDAGTTVEVDLNFVADAFPALLAGNGALHDRLVAAEIDRLRSDSDVVVLAQASMARVLDLPSLRGGGTPILSSPHLALGQLRQILSEVKPTAAAVGVPQ